MNGTLLFVPDLMPNVLRYLIILKPWDIPSFFL